MSEDSSFNKNKPQMNTDERRCGVDFCDSLGKGMLAKEKIETLGNSSGLTPLSFGVNDNNRTMDRENNEIIRTETTPASVSSHGVRTSSLLNYSDKYSEKTEILKNSSGLSPFCPSGEIYSTKKKSLSMVEGFSANKGLETPGNSFRLTPLNYDIKPQIKEDERRISPLRMQSPVIKNLAYKGE
jgi:hypothetical protein